MRRFRPQARASVVLIGGLQLAVACDSGSEATGRSSVAEPGLGGIDAAPPGNRAEPSATLDVSASSQSEPTAPVQVPGEALEPPSSSLPPSSPPSTTESATMSSLLPDAGKPPPAAGGALSDAATPPSKLDSGTAASADDIASELPEADASPEAPEDAVPSPGCALASAPRPDSYERHLVRYPTYYDSATPMPVIIAFHDNYAFPSQMVLLLQDDPRAQDYVMVYAGSENMFWEPRFDSPRIDELLNQLLADVCVDESRIFVVALGGGGEYLGRELCTGEDRYRALAQVAGLSACKQWTHPVPSLVIHGAEDRVRDAAGDPDGTVELERFQTTNLCTGDATPQDVPACQSDGEDVAPGCVNFSSCETPLRWCQHDELGPQGDNHFWPCFATNAVFDFFAEHG